MNLSTDKFFYTKQIYEIQLKSRPKYEIKDSKQYSNKK